ncbi:hypothetical protein [Paraburkholderia phosphatilytica]|uniref:hypothetical protein n=1 Tax=Paraburkholderia phosphatilytica TaxID=2282883 RepID=UPI000E4CE50B|nr:hypothetical protein [Paraburkholderia phosphatilytica]
MNRSPLPIEALVEQARKNTASLSTLAAKAVAYQTFVEAVLPMLTAAQTVDLSMRFQQRIEDVMAVMDDIALPADYHATLLAKTNELLAALRDDQKRV